MESIHQPSFSMEISNGEREPKLGSMLEMENALFLFLDPSRMTLLTLRNKAMWVAQAYLLIELVCNVIKFLT